MALPKAIRAWLCNNDCVFVCVTGPGHGHTVWQTAMKNRLVLAHQMRRIPQNSWVTKPFFLEARGEQMSLYNNIITPLNWKWAETDSHWCVEAECSALSVHLSTHLFPHVWKPAADLMKHPVTPLYRGCWVARDAVMNKWWTWLSPCPPPPSPSSVSILCSRSYVGGHRPSKIMRFVDKIAKSKYFQKATETEFIKKKMEEVSNTPLLLTVEVQECRGTLAVNIPPPPTDRIWYVHFHGGVHRRLWDVVSDCMGILAITQRPLLGKYRHV